MSRARRRRPDVGALLVGVVLLAVAGLVLWTSLGWTVDWGLVVVLAPIALIVLGVLGLTLSRRPHRDR